MARNRLGMILGLASIPFVVPFTPRMTEALGFREALAFAASNGCAGILV